MKFLETSMVVTAILWCFSALFFVYAIGMLLLHFDWKLFLLSVLLGLVATGLHFLLGILNDG